MTPSLSPLYEALVALLTEPSLATLLDPTRAEDAAIAGAISPAQGDFEERTRALFDRGLTTPSVVHGLRAVVDGDLAWALETIAASERGIFELRRTPADQLDLSCVACGAAFRVSSLDATTRGLAGVDRAHRPVDEVAPGLVDARVVATREGVAVLPGAIVHAPEATESIQAVVRSEAATNVAHDRLLDMLLTMRQRLQARSRVRAHQIYRADAIASIR